MDNRDQNTAPLEAHKYYGDTWQQTRNLANTGAPTPKTPGPLDKAKAVLNYLCQIEDALETVYERLYGPQPNTTPGLGKDVPGYLDDTLAACCQKGDSICSRVHQINAKLWAEQLEIDRLELTG